MPESDKVELSAEEQRIAQTLPSALLLALTGGSLDAFIYLNHGHVFAAAMTGNGVLLGVSVLRHDWMQVLRHGLPIVAFIVGVFLASFLNSTLKHYAVTAGLLCEIGVLLVASFLPGGFPDLVYIPMIAVVAAYQVASFKKAENYSYNSTFMTGNLRAAVEGLYMTLDPARRSEGFRQFRDLSLIVLMFLVGATVGALLSPRLLNHTLWVVDLPLLAVLMRTMWQSVPRYGRKK